jgi:hypothetical protein
MCVAVRFHISQREERVPYMTRSIPKLAPEDIIEWPDGERARVTWVAEDGQFFRVEGLPLLLRATDDFRVVSIRLDVPD